MRTVEQTASFKKCLRRMMAGRFKAAILAELPLIVETLANDIDLPDKYRDHSLTGNWQGHNECHIRPDLLLIYQKIGDDKLYLVEIDNHSGIFG
ncbi:MAG: type II toxin-antitoxin system YafQ family toxin [Synergistaceae bacterium]|nr:type II toxin-antitoxin system YafQ family toxin [Synergistaceae bacterium]